MEEPGKENSQDMNGNPLPMPIRVLRFLGFGAIGTFIFASIFLGADTQRGLAQASFGVMGGGIALMLMRYTRWLKSSTRTKRFAIFMFLGILVGTALGVVLFGRWSLSDSIAFGLGAGLSNGVLMTLGAVSIRTAILSFAKIGP